MSSNKSKGKSIEGACMSPKALTHLQVNYLMYQTLGRKHLGKRGLSCTNVPLVHPTLGQEIEWSSDITL